MRQQLKEARTGAISRGYFTAANEPPEVVGPDRLPCCVPANNTSISVAMQLAEGHYGPDNDDDDDDDDMNTTDEWNSHLAVAWKMAAKHEIEIKVHARLLPFKVLFWWCAALYAIHFSFEFSPSALHYRLPFSVTSNDTSPHKSPP